MGCGADRAGEIVAWLSQSCGEDGAKQMPHRSGVLAIVSTTQALLEQAQQFHRAGELRQAADLYNRLLEQYADSLDLKYLLGTVHLQLADFDASVELLQQVVESQPIRADACNNLGIALKAIGDWQSAAQNFEAAIRADSEYGQAWFNLASLMADRGLHADAVKCFQQSVQLDPQDLAARLGLAKALSQSAEWAAAERELQHVLTQQPEHVEALVMRGFVLVKQERLDEAVDDYRAVLRVQPDYYQVHNSLSFVFERQGRCQQALDSAEHALALHENFAEGQNNRGVALRSLHRLDEAENAFRQALQINPQMVLAEFNLGTTCLLRGDYQQGWQGYLRYADLTAEPATTNRTAWEGQSLPGGTLVVSSDQGFGDTLQFVRWLPRVRELSQAQIVLDCQPELSQLLQDSQLADQVVVDAEPIQADAEVALSALGSLLGITAADLPGAHNYVVGKGASGPVVQQKLRDAPTGHLRVGLAWQGNPLQTRDHARSCPLDALSCWKDMDGVAWFGLQTGQLGRSQLSGLADTWPIVDLGGELLSFTDTAAAIMELDLVITVDTAVAHLAGALGASVWVLLCHTPDWRWQLNREDCDWYPSMRLFRQPVWGDWHSVAEQVRLALHEHRRSH